MSLFLSLATGMMTTFALTSALCARFQFLEKSRKDN